MYVTFEEMEERKWVNGREEKKRKIPTPSTNDGLKAHSIVIEQRVMTSVLE